MRRNCFDKSDLFANFAVEKLSNMDISKILKDGERVTLECKKARNNVPNSMWETYSAFANTYGGIILLGVVEHND